MFPHRKVLNNLCRCRHSPLQEVTLNALPALPHPPPQPLQQTGLSDLLLKNRVCKGEVRSCLQRTHLPNATWARWSRLISPVVSPVDNMYPLIGCDMKGTPPLWFLPQNLQSQGNQKKNIRQTQIKGILQNNYQ